MQGLFQKIAAKGEKMDRSGARLPAGKEPEILYTGKKKDFISSYLFVTDKTKNKDLEKEYIASKELDDRIEGLIDANKKDVFVQNGIEPKEPDLEQIMVYLERSKNNESFTL